MLQYVSTSLNGEHISPCMLANAPCTCRRKPYTAAYAAFLGRTPQLTPSASASKAPFWNPSAPKQSAMGLPLCCPVSGSLSYRDTAMPLRRSELPAAGWNDGADGQSAWMAMAGECCRSNAAPGCVLASPMYDSKSEDGASSWLLHGPWFHCTVHMMARSLSNCCAACSVRHSTQIAVLCGPLLQSTAHPHCCPKAKQLHLLHTGLIIDFHLSAVLRGG